MRYWIRSHSVHGVLYQGRPVGGGGPGGQVPPSSRVGENFRHFRVSVRRSEGEIVIIFAPNGAYINRAELFSVFPRARAKNRQFLKLFA